MRRIAVIASCSGNGKTTLARELADRLGLRLVEMDYLAYGPNWRETPGEELRLVVSPIVAGDGWVVDSLKARWLGDLIPRHADTVIWLDLPIRVWFPRLVKRTISRMRSDEDLWHGNRERFRGTVVGRNPLFVRALKAHWRSRRQLPALLMGHNVVRLRTPAEVDAFLEQVGRPPRDTIASEAQQ